VASQETGPSTAYSVRRTVPRFSLIASAEIIEPASGLRIPGRISEVSRKGCYVDLLNTLPAGTNIVVRISRDQGNFESQGKIIYVQESMGMGVAFLDPPADQLKILDSWLAELAV
jgi:PilZ domain